MKSSEINFSPFSLYFAVIQPISGKITKKDFQIIKKENFSTIKQTGNELVCFTGKRKELSLKSKLSKKYKVVYITDYQFGKTKFNQSFLNVATKKQIANYSNL